MTKIIFNVPPPDAPGFARRTIKLSKFAKLKDMKADDVDMASIFEELVDFLAEFVEAPSIASARELLLDASETEFFQMLDALGDAVGGASEAVPPEKSVTSEKALVVTK